MRSEELRQRQLRAAKRRATGLLAAVAVVFVAITAVGGHAAWRGYLQATAEASLVGGLADWFAVTALFRHPLGIPIPHTAVIIDRKQQFGATLGEFIRESLLTPAAIVDRVRAGAAVPRLAAWVAQPANAGRVAGQLADLAVAAGDLLDDEEIRDTIAAAVRRGVESVPFAPLAAAALRQLSAGGRQAEVIDAGLRSLAGYVDAHRDELRARLAAQSSPWWLPGAVEDRIFERLLDGVCTVLADMTGDPDHHLRVELDRALTTLIGELETSPAWRERGETLKAELLAQPQLREWSAAVWRDLAPRVRAELLDPTSELRTRLEGTISGFGARLLGDPALTSHVEEAVEAAVSYVAERFNGEIAALVTTTISRWDGDETSRRLELLLGPDLQYIRINGTVVGAAAGLVLYTVSRLA